MIMKSLAKLGDITQADCLSNIGSRRHRTAINHLGFIQLRTVTFDFSQCVLHLYSLPLQDTVSVHRPRFYAHRFLDFMADRVFKKIPSRKWLFYCYISFTILTVSTTD